MKYFFVSLSEGRLRVVERVFDIIKGWDQRTRRFGVRVGVLLRFNRWRVCLPCMLADKYDIPVFIDNGAFDYLARGFDRSVLYRWVSDYVLWLRSWSHLVTGYALPDIPVHDGPRFLGERERMERIELSGFAHVEFARRARDGLLSKGVVVLQGYMVDEYDWSYSLLAGHEELAATQSFSGRGPYGGVFGVGSVCVRKPSSNGKSTLLAGGRAAGTLTMFMREFLNYGWGVRGIRGFHFFGLHRGAVGGFGRHSLFFASDSGAHGFNFKFKWRSFLKCDAPNSDCYIRAVDHQLRITLTPILRPTLMEVVSGG